MAKKYILTSEDRVKKVLNEVKKKILLIFGSRDYTPEGAHLVDFKQTIARLKGWPNEWVVMSGGANGVDKWAETFAEESGVSCIVFPANWDKFNKKAGMLRNQEMVDCRPRYSVAFHKGFSTGTMDTISKLEADNLRATVYNVDTDQLKKEQIGG